MKKLKLILIIILTTVSASYAQNWEWVKTIGGGSGPFNTNTVTSGGVVLAPNGNIYCSGSFRGWDMWVDTFFLQGGGYWNSFIAQFSPSGSLSYITEARGFNAQNDMSNMDGITSDENSNIYVCGNVIGTFLVDTIYIPNAGGCFIAKFNSETRCLWTKISGNSLSSLSHPVYHNQSIYTSGLFSGDSINLDTVHLTNPGSWAQYKSFLSKFDTTGYCIWAKAAMGGLTDITRLNQNGNFLYLAGRSDSCFIYDTLQVCMSKPLGSDVIFKADTNGSVRWSANLSSANPFGISTVSLDGTGALYLSCAYDSIYQLGSTTLLQQVDTAAYSTFMVKYDSIGSIVWIKQWYSTGELNPRAAYTDYGGNTYLTGFFNDEISLGGDTIRSESNSDMFVARIDRDGNCLGLISVPNAAGFGITQDSAGNAIVIGQIYNTGPAAFDENIINAAGLADFFIAKLGTITGGIPRLAENNQLRIYANPSGGNFTIEVPKELVSSYHLHLGIYDNAGKTVKEEEVDISHEKLNVELGLVTKGIYTVTLSKGHKKYTGRVIIE